MRHRVRDIICGGIGRSTGGCWATLAGLALMLGGCSAIGVTSTASSGSAQMGTSGSATTGTSGSATTGTSGSATTGTSGSARVATAETTHEYPAPPPPAERAPGAPSAEQAILAFAGVYINWTAGSVTRNLRGLAAASVGQARSAMQLAAAQTAADYELRRGGIANHGTVEAIAPVLHRRHAFVVVTRESTTASNTAAYQGLRPAWHVTVVAVRRLVGGGWVVSGWQPEG
jgi:hypothetical protein